MEYRLLIPFLNPVWLQYVSHKIGRLLVQAGRLTEAAPRIPAVRHSDGTARVQTVSRSQNPLYHDMIEAFARRTGVPVVINTSFNTRGEPVVCSPRDAVECFYGSPLDALVIGSFLLEKGGSASESSDGNGSSTARASER